VGPRCRRSTACDGDRSIDTREQFDRIERNPGRRVKNNEKTGKRSKNAAMVEESPAASHALGLRSKSLQRSARTVPPFRIGRANIEGPVMDDAQCQPDLPHRRRARVFGGARSKKKLRNPKSGAKASGLAGILGWRWADSAYRICWGLSKTGQRARWSQGGKYLT